MSVARSADTGRFRQNCCTLLKSRNTATLVAEHNVILDLVGGANFHWDRRYGRDGWQPGAVESD